MHFKAIGYGFPTKNKLLGLLTETPSIRPL
jgi:hypothetical protein